MKTDVYWKHVKHMQHARFLGDLYSKDRSTKVGALIIGQDGEPLSWGYNGFPRGVNDEKPERHDRNKEKYLWSEHAERNAIFSAARSGHKLLGSRIYVSRLPTCVDCARAIIQAGITDVFVQSEALSGPAVNPKWLEHWNLVTKMYAEAGVRWYELAGTESESGGSNPEYPREITSELDQSADKLRNTCNC